MIKRLASASVNHSYRTILVWLAALFGVVVIGRRRGPFDDLTPREREVLGLMAQGRSNSGIARHLVVSDGAVETPISLIFAKLGLATSDTEHRRVLAVLQYIQHS